MINLTRKLGQPATTLFATSKCKVKNQLEKLFPIQANSICHKKDLDPEQLAVRLPPFDYKNKRFTYLHQFFKLEGFHPTMGKFTENTKIVVVEGNVGAGKAEFAKKLADDLGMAYFPDIDPELDYRFEEDGFDYRDLNLHLHENVKYADFKSVLESQNPFQAGYWEVSVLRMRVFKYLQALTHLLNTGDGIVMERSPWTGTVFARTMMDMNLLSRNYIDHYWEVRSAAFQYMHRPHVVIYLDVPVDKCLENARKKNTHGTGPHLTEEYLELIEKNYKKHFLPTIEEHAELFSYKLNEAVTDETAAELSELVVDELSQSDMDEYYMRITSKSEKFDDWRLFDSDERFSKLRGEIMRDQTDIQLAFQFYPYYVDELWPAHSLLSARMYITATALAKRQKKLYAQKSFKEKLLGTKETYDEKVSFKWLIKTGHSPDHVQGTS